MDPGLLARRADLLALRSRTEADPARHAAQALALARETALAQAAHDMPQYLARSASGFELNRAAWLDRHRVLLQVALDLCDPMAAEAAQAALAAALRARGPADWVAALQRGAMAQAGWSARAAEAAHGATRALVNLLIDEGGQGWMAADARAIATQAWLVATAADPTLATALARGTLAQHPWAARLPWRGAALQAVARLLQALPAAEADAVPARSTHEVQADWQTQARAWVTSLAGANEEVVQPAANPSPAALADPACAAVVQAGLALLDTLAQADADWPEPLRQAHGQRTRAALADARTELQALQVLAHAQAAWDVENDWQALLLLAASLPLRGLAGVACLGDDQRHGLAKALRWSHTLCGLGPRALLRHPELQRRLQQQVQPWLRSGRPVPTVGPGDAGAELLAPLQAWLAMRAMSTGQDATTLAGRLGPALCEHLDELGVDEPPAVPVPLCLWGRHGTLADWAPWMAAPPRPPAREPGGMPL